MLVVMVLGSVLQRPRGGHEDGPCVGVIEDICDIQSGRLAHCRMVILIDLRTKGVVVVEAPDTRGRRRWKVGLSWGFGPDAQGIAGLCYAGPCRIHGAEETVKTTLLRGHAPEPEGVHGEANETTCPSPCAYHDISSSSVRSTSGFASANSSADPELALGNAILLITSGWICTRCAVGALRS